MANNDNAITELLKWYASISSRHVDLVGDYAGSELFFIEGDSLLLRCFSDSKLDFDGGFQLLHAVYVVEHFIQGLVQRKCRFNIVFFDEHRHLCIPPTATSSNHGKYLLARSVISRHLEVYLMKSHPSITLHTFISAQDSRFNDYLKQSGVYFMMCHDGASTMTLDGEPAAKSNKRETTSRVEPGVTFRAANRIGFRRMIYLMIIRGYNVALVNGVEWMDTKIMTMVLEGSRWAKVLSFIDEVDFLKLKLRDSRSEIPIESLLMNLGFDAHSTTQVHKNLGEQELCRTVEGSASLPKNMESTGNTSSDYRQSFSEREYLTIVALALILQHDSLDASLVVAFLAHTVLIGETRVTDRPVLWKNDTSDEDPKIRDFVARFSCVCYDILNEKFWGFAMNNKQVRCDIADLIDGRLLAAISHKMANLSGHEKARFNLGSKIKKYLQALHLACGVHLELQQDLLLSEPSLRPSPEMGQVVKKTSVLPFSSAVFDKHLVSIKITVDPSTTLTPQTARVFQEISHWHNSKRRLDTKATHTLSEKEKFWVLKKNQFFMAEMQAYAASLTNASGRSLEPEIVTISDTKKGRKMNSEHSLGEEISGSRKSNNPKTSSNRKGGVKSVRETIAANQSTKDSGFAEKTIAAWQNTRKALDVESQLSSKYTKTIDYLRDLPKEKRTILQAEVQFYIVTILLDIYQSLSRQSSNTSGTGFTDTMKETPRDGECYGVAALIFDTSRTLSTTPGFTKSIALHVREILRVLGLPSIEFPLPTVDRALLFRPNLSLPFVDIALDPIDFQCQHYGPYMDRNLDSAFDPRVPFRPDGWQRQVLDVLDSNQSVFVVAPTSAGKTFISFYAMERILKSDDESVLVYVAPTKALVNQIAAEIQARYKKTYKYPGKSVWAIHTRDYKVNNPTGCQILVTVPHILQIMLLSPNNAKTWSRKVKKIIFDEIHSIGNLDGVIWEQLLLMAPCPIIALSATVGNPEQFNSWLASSQKAAGFQLTMIKHQHRYSDLRKFLFHPPKRFAFKGLPKKYSFASLGLDGLENFSFIHPVATLTNKHRGMPDDLTLEARDCLSLWKVMTRVQSKEFPVDSSLDPIQNGLGGTIKKSDIIRWEERLKSFLGIWMRDTDSPFDKVVEELSRSMKDRGGVEEYISGRSAADCEDEELTLIDEDDLTETTLPLLCRLHERDALPAIFFNYDRGKCEAICKALTMKLETAESSWKTKSSVWKKKLSDWEQWKLEQLKTAKKTPKTSSKSKGKEDEGDIFSKADRIQDAASSEVSPFAAFDPDAPVDGFHFAIKHKVELSEINQYLFHLKRRGLAQWLLDGLVRGIGVHHAGMNRKYRQVVEMLFRKGYLRVVIATGTLALGINMPCATVVFSGDSVFLTALNFRQAAGRAGRRGFDLLGNVVFQNVSETKACRLISSRLPDLAGHFPITTTLVLRLFTLLHESESSPYAIQVINALLSQPRLYLDGPSFKEQVLHHLRFSIEYLRRQTLLSAQGAPLNLAGLTSHLYYTENSSFAMNALLKGGYFHDLCSGIYERESSVLRTLMIVMAHLFVRRPCREADQEYIEKVKRSSSIVFLPPLPSQAAQILREHNQDTLNVFTTYVKTFVEQHIQDNDCTLPLTGYMAGCSNTYAGLPKSTLTVRSAFVGLSGHGDTFESISDLCSTTRGGVFLEEAVIPHLDVYPDESKTPHNAYLYDFFMHGDIETLERANGIRKSDVWFLLNDFSLVLATIITSLANFLKLPESDLNLLDIMGGGEEQHNLEDEKDVKDLPGDKSDTSTGSASTDKGRSIIPASKSKPPPKKKVLDSWDNEDVDDGAAEPVLQNGANGKGGENIKHDRSNEELEKGFTNIYVAFVKLRSEFDTKFRIIFA